MQSCTRTRITASLLSDDHLHKQMADFYEHLHPQAVWEISTFKTQTLLLLSKS